ncbi:hypothetical protein [Rhodopseudomonas palustris]|uniref:Uncharacterized protein n=1 Tax=Rhodopseudomonas palustris (strain BisB18) TaxID=316056 RepID=Q213R0_RHOPB
MATPNSHDPSFWAAVEIIKKSRETKLCMASSSSDPCTGPIIAAHTIPRSQLQHLAEDGHVFTLFGNLQTFAKTQGKLELARKGIRTFSTLNCFCSHHDVSVFSPIENAPLTFTPQQIACLHYRAIAAEMYRKMTALAGLEKTLSDLPKSKKMKRTTRQDFAQRVLCGTKLGLIDVGRTFQRCEDALFCGRFDDVSGLMIKFRQPPTLMSVGGFSPAFDYRGRRLQDLSDETASCDQVSISVLSSFGKAAVIFAWVKGANAPKLFAESFLRQQSSHYTTLIIQTLFEHLENTCMNITWWDGLRSIERKLLTERMQAAIEPERRPSAAYTYCGVTFDDWGYEDHEYINA